MRIALVCGEAAGARVLQAVAGSRHRLVCLLATGPAQRLGEKLGYDPRPLSRVREPGFAAELAALGVELLLNVHSLYRIPVDVLAVPRHGAWNLHPGPLPRYAGLNAPSWSIVHGETQHGVTVHRMEDGIDTGDIAYQEIFPVTEADTGLTVALRCAERGVALVERLLADAPDIPRRAQDLSRRSYFGKGVPQDGWIDWNAPARRIHDFVRAFDYGPFASPWGVPRAVLGGEEVQIRRVRRTGERCAASPGTVRGERVATADEWLVYQRSA